MGKMRVHELAKKLNLTNQDLIAKLSTKGITVRTHSSSVDEAESLRVLGLSKNGDAARSARTKTVLRRRRKEPEATPVEATSQADEQPANELQASKSGPQQIEPEVVTTKEETPVVEQEAVEPKVQAGAKVFKEEFSSEEPKKAVVEAPKNNNVVRVIDAEAIKARLAQEGRTFRPRTPRSGLPRGGASGVREVRVVNPGFGAAPQMMDVTPAANKPGWKPTKKKARGGFDKTKKEAGVGGGYELWLSPGRKKRGAKKGAGKGPVITTAAAHKRIVELTGPITVNELAHRMSIKAGQVVTKLMRMGMMVTVNQPIDLETASIVASEFEYEVKNIGFEETDLLSGEQDAPESLMLRAPVVTVMGHVDHGKTSILDAIKKSDVAAGEAGGITQHIGAYSVDTSHGKITFLDTPGHEAFTTMRARGAEITDIVVLVVAADDGVMPQTIEAIDHAKAANVPIVVAVNKMDSVNAKPDRVLQQLAERNVVTEAWGGDVQVFKVSALKRQGLEELVEGIAMLAEMQELKANPDKMAEGFVVEAKLDKGRGPVATILTQAGTLKQGEYLVAGEYSGRVRAMYDSNGKLLKETGPSTPVQVLGLSGVPDAGDKFNIVKDEKTAKTIIEHRAQQKREKELMQTSRVSLENFLESTPDSKSAELRLIVKADVFGSVEALSASLIGLSTTLVKVDVVHKDVGTITENNVNLAVASGAIIIGFNTKPDAKAQTLATQEKVDVRTYRVIYEALNEVKNAMAGLLQPITEENYLGKAEVRMVISVGKGRVAGSYVFDGKIIRSAKLKVKRKGKVVHIGSIASLKRFKDDVKEVSAGYECGVSLESFIDVQEGDMLECFELKQVTAIDLGEKLVDVEAD